MRLLFTLVFTLLFICACTDAKQAAMNECAEGNGEGCRKLGQIFEDNGDTKGAKDNYDLSCKLANTNGCVRLSELLVKEGKPTEAMEKLKYACDRGNTNACARYAALLAKE